MKKQIYLILITAILITAVRPMAGRAQEPDAAAVITRAWDHMRGITSVSVVKMIVHREDWQRTSRIKAWTRGQKDSLFQIISPKKDRDNGTLKLGPDMWTFNPKINRVIKIPPSMMSQSWMGSDFSNNDLSKADSILKDYTHTIVGQSQDSGMTVFEIKSLPKPSAPVVWGMQTLKIREDGVILEEAFYDEDMSLVKIMTTTNIRDMGGRPFPAKWTMRTADAGSDQDFTLLEYESLTFDKPLPESRFGLGALRKPVR